MPFGSIQRAECAVAAVILLLTQLQLNLVQAAKSKNKITVTRLDDGDEFTNPSSCDSPCPVDSLKANISCECKCLSQFTWRQDEGKCIKSSGCDFTVLAGNYIPTLTIQDKQDKFLKPVDHALRQNGQVLSSGGYEIKKMYLLGDDPWKEANKNDFYIAQEGGSDLRVKSRTQLADVADYTGTLLNFTVQKGSDIGCLVVKIGGILKYKSKDFPLAVTSGGTILPTFHATNGYTVGIASTSHSTIISGRTSTAISHHSPASTVVMSLTTSVVATSLPGLSGHPSGLPATISSDSSSPLMSTISLTSDLSPAAPTGTIPSTLSGTPSQQTTTDDGFTVSISRLDDGDEFTRSTPCSGHCPANSLPKLNDMCTCKCRLNFTWRQDLDMCILTSGCAYTVLDGNYIPALTIQGTMDQTLLPEDHVLRFDGNIIHNSNVYEIKTFYILKDGERNFWEEAERSHDFYTIRENSEQKIKSQTDPKFVGDYSGVLFNFTLSLLGSEVGCLMVKITGSHQYTYKYVTEVSQSANTVTVSSSQSPTLPNVVVDAIEQKSGDNGGAIAGGIVGGIVILLIVVGVLIIVYKRKRMNRDKSVVNHELGSTLCNPSYDANEIVDLNKPTGYEKVTSQPNTESDAVYEDPCDTLPSSAKASEANEVYEEPSERPDHVVVANYYESCKPMYDGANHGHSKSVDMNKPVSHGGETVPLDPNPENNMEHEDSVNIFKTGKANELYEWPEPVDTKMSERSDYDRPLPATPNGTCTTYKSLLPQIENQTSNGTCTSLFGYGNSLYEEIASAVAGTE